jgi:hypothetical protein
VLKPKKKEKWDMRCLAILMVALFVATTVQAEPDYPPGALSLEARLLTKIGPQTRAWIKTEARREVTIGYYSPDTQAEAAIRYGAPTANFTTLSFLVLMQAARDADADVHAAVDSRNMAATQVAREEQLANGINKYSVQSELSPGSDIAAQQGTAPTLLSSKFKTQDPATIATTHPNEAPLDLSPPPPPKSVDMQNVMDRESDIEDTLAKVAKTVTPALEASVQPMG